MEVKNHPKKLWVEKSNNHRGIHIKSPNEIDLHKGSDENFVQEYIANPYLIDKRSCFIVYRKAKEEDTDAEEEACWTDQLDDFQVIPGQKAITHFSSFQYNCPKSGYILTLQISVFDILFKGLISSIQPAFLSWVRQFINAKLQNNNTINKTFIYLGSLTELSTRTNDRYVMDSKLVVKLKGVLIFKLVLPLF
ncbi:hypothetical protein pdam_00022311 [Pocillopora damicornis]|uniref:Uncharacterized protein n=1 Tax=Pocillopora damicornis TaxID=46731 RepID=A0A3M6U6Y9_POCDA|nr:hypothetical protein pdam_00022311 [Pocillopora damicornis]